MENTFYLLGKTLKHSFSKEIHNMLGNNNYFYKELNENELKSFVLNKNYKGLNVTIPYKKAVMEYLDEIDIYAQNIGAVNTVVNKNGKLLGFNTDFYGLKNTIIYNNITLKNKTVLILGSGGTSLTAKEVAKNLEAKKILIVSRHKKEEDGYITYPQAEKKYSNAEIIINTTPVGMFPNNFNSPLNTDNFNNLEAVVDVIYNPLHTLLTLKAKEKNIKTSNGLFMLVSQAAKSNELFFNEADKDENENKKTYEVYGKLLKQKQNLVLIGMPGSGKTTLGLKVAKELNKDFFDCDKEIEKAYNKTPAEIIKTEGEEAFRAKETLILKQLSLKNNSVIAPGGGAVLNPDNILYLKQNGKIIYLNRPVELIIKNINNNKAENSNKEKSENKNPERPLTKTAKDFENIFNKRKSLYKKYAEKEVLCDNNFSNELKNIKEAFLNDRP